MKMNSILLLENKSDNCILISDYLRKHLTDPTEVVCCRSYEEAFGYLFCQKWDLVLINYDLKPRSGLDTLRRIKTLLDENDATPIAVYRETLYDFDTVAQTLKEGASDFISLENLKNRQPLDLLRVVRKIEGDHLSENTQTSLL